VSITKVRAASPDKSIREKVLPVSVALDAKATRPRRWPRNWPHWASLT
jgi:glycyl-tRNA synthetase beta chain